MLRPARLRDDRVNNQDVIDTRFSLKAILALALGVAAASNARAQTCEDAFRSETTAAALRSHRAVEAYFISKVLSPALKAYDEMKTTQSPTGVVDRKAETAQDPYQTFLEKLMGKTQPSTSFEKTYPFDEWSDQVANSAGFTRYRHWSRPIAQTPSQKRNAAIAALVERSRFRSIDLQAAAGASELFKSSRTREVALRRQVDGDFTYSDLERLSAHPEEFAMVYAQLSGLIGYSGEAGAALTAFVPWSKTTTAANTAANTAAEASYWAKLRDLAILLNATMYHDPTQQAGLGIATLQYLEIKYAPHLRGAYSLSF